MDIRRLSSIEGLPVDLDALKLDLRIDDDDDDDTLVRMSQSAAALIERRSGYVLIPGEFEVLVDSIWGDDCGHIYRTPFRELTNLAAMTGRNEWTDLDVEDFRVIESPKFWQLSPFHGTTCPSLYTHDRGIRLRFRAGFDVDGESEGEISGAGDFPVDPLVRGVFIALVGHYYENRELFAADKLTEIESTSGGMLNAIRTFW